MTKTLTLMALAIAFISHAVGAATLEVKNGESIQEAITRVHIRCGQRAIAQRGHPKPRALGGVATHALGAYI